MKWAVLEICEVTELEGEEQGTGQWPEGRQGQAGELFLGQALTAMHGAMWAACMAKLGCGTQRVETQEHIGVSGSKMNFFPRQGFSV